MSFIVETGTGIKGATSYATLQFFRDYFADRPDATAAAAIADADVQLALVAATDYIDTRWGLRFLGRRRWLELLPRSVLTVTANPADGETVTFGTNTYTFKTTPTVGVDTDVEIGTSDLVSLANLSSAIALVDTDDFQGSEFVDPDVASVTLFSTSNGTVTTETLANGSFDGAVTAGASARQQPLEWPRIRIRDRASVVVEGVPVRVQESTAEYAFRADTAKLDPDPVVDATGARVTGSKTKVGPIETSTKFAEETGIQITKPYPAADRLLQEYIFPPGVVRA